MIRESMDELATNATTIDGFAEVEKCREEEAAREARQRQQAGFLSIFTGAMDVVADLPVVSFLGGAADTIVDLAHQDQNAAADNCDRMLADLTLEKIDEIGSNLTQGFDEVKSKLNNMEDKMDTHHQEQVRMLANISNQIQQGNREMQVLIQKEVMQEMKTLGKDTALLSSKLDQVSQKIEESMQLTEVATYKTLYARMAAAMAAVRGGFADIVSSVQNQRYHQVSLPHVHLDINKMQVARAALQEWKEKEIALMEQKHTVLQSSWGKARDSFIEIRAVLVEGDLLYEHFKIHLRTLAAHHIDNLAHNDLEDFLRNFDLRQKLSTAVEDDPLITVLLATVSSATAVLEMYLAIFPNYDDVKEFSQSVTDMQKYIWDVDERIRGAEFLSSALLAPVLAKFPIDEECQRAAFRSGFKETENMVQWKNNWIALAPKVLNGSTDKAFFECTTRGNQASGVTDQSFAAKTEYRCHEGQQESMRCSTAGCMSVDTFNRRCNNKIVELSVNCPTDYRISSMNIDSATFTCKSTAERRSTQESTGLGGPQGSEKITVHRYYVSWDCTDKASGTAVNLDHLKTCTLMPNAGTKTFEAKTSYSLPYNASNLPIPKNDTGSMRRLNTYVSKVYDRTDLILRFGPFCNKLDLGLHKVWVGPNFLQLSPHWRLRSDPLHLWIESETLCSYVFRYDHRVFADDGRRASSWDNGAPTMILKSVNMDIPAGYGIKFGWKFIQIGTWRLAEHDGERLSISHQNGNVAEVHHKDGTRTNPGGTSDAWTRPVGDAEGVFFGFQFIQIGAFRVGTSDPIHLSVSHVKTGKTSVIYRVDGTVHWGWGIRSDLNPVGRPVCIGHKDSV